MLDTNLCVRVLRDRPANIKPRFDAEINSLTISSVVLFELLHGALKSNRPIENRREVERFAKRVEVLDFADDAAAHAGDIRIDLQRRGLQIGAYDILIAGHARSRGLVVVTGNLGEFCRVDGLRCEDWLSS